MVFRLIIKEIECDSKNTLIKWVDNLEENLSQKLLNLKGNNIFFQNKGKVDYLTTLAIGLEKYIIENTKNLDILISKFTDINEVSSYIDICNEINDMSSDIPEAFFENRLILNNIENVIAIYHYYNDKYKKMSDTIIKQLKDKYNLYNY